MKSGAPILIALTAFMMDEANDHDHRNVGVETTNFAQRVKVTSPGHDDVQECGAAPTFLPADNSEPLRRRRPHPPGICGSEARFG